MNYLKRLISVVALLAVAACGGGGGNPGDPITGPGSGSGSVADIVLVLSATTVTNKGTDTIVATATAVDGNRNAVADVPLTISVDSNAVATTSATTTNAAGQLAATIGIGSDRTNRTITVTAKAGSLTRTTTLAVVDAAATNSASDLVLVLSSTTIANTGTRTVTATVTALDGKRNALTDVAVTLTADNGAVVTTPSKVTGTAGTVTATIGIGSNQTNRDIVVTAQSGSLTRSTVLKVVTDPGSTTPTADDLSLVISAPSVTNGGSNTITATATAVDRNRNVVAGIPVTFAVDASATASVSGTVTNANGVVTATIGIGSDRSNRLVTVTATAAGITRTASFVVTGAKLTSSSSPLVVASTEGNVIEYTLVDFNAIAMANQAVTVQGAGLTTATGRTDLNGKFRYVYKAPTITGSITVTATAAGDSRTDTIEISAGSSTVPVVTASILSASVTPTPSVVTVNTIGSSTNQVELRALFVGADNKPLKGVRARFDLAGDKTSTDGVVSWVGTYAYSDVNGIARGTFTPGQRSSPTNGITIRVCYDGGDFASGADGACSGVAKFATATLTVASEALSVSIRTNELIKLPADELTYVKEYVVMVVDAAGQAKADVVITPSVDLTGFRKGFWIWDGVIYQQIYTLDNDQFYSWNGEAWVTSTSPDRSTLPTCPNEDANRNGVLEGLPISGGSPPAVSSRREDLNWNGSIDPRKADVAVKMVGSNKTDANGLAIVQVQYGRNVASWLDYVLTVTASGVSGTEARAKTADTTPYPALAIRTESQVPAFALSPYGPGRYSGIPLTSSFSPLGVCTEDR